MPITSIRSHLLRHFSLIVSLAFIISMGLLALLAAQSVQAQSAEIFKDVTKDHYFAEAIKALKEDGIVQGNPDGTYAPTSQINRAEFTAIVVRAVNPGPFTGKNCFTDVHEEWFAGTTCFAKENNIIDGFADGSFKPGDTVTFGQAAKILANTYKLMTGAETKEWEEVYTRALADTNAIPVSVEFLDEPLTRDEMAEMIYRLEEDIENKTSRTYEEIKGEGLVTVDSCEALQDRYERAYLYDDGDKGGIIMPMAPAMEDAANQSETGGGSPGQPVMAPSKDATAPGGDDYSTTNVQVDGVDEGDIIKNDDKYIYVLKNNTVRIVEAYPAQNLKELVSITLGEEGESIYPIEMYVYDDTLTIIGSKYASYTYPLPVDSTTDSDAASTTKMIAPYFQNRTIVYVVDITDRSKPTVQRSVEFDGNYHSSRRIGDTLYTIVNKYTYYPYTYGVKELPLEGFFIPMMKDSAVGKEEQIAPCNEIKMLPKPEQFNFLTVAGIPLDDDSQAVSREVILGDTQNIYASTENLYVAAPYWRESYYGNEQTQTTFYKFALENGMVEYKAYGRVPGTILNQFSMDEQDGYFRTATTSYNYTTAKNTNNLYVLDEQLSVVGKIENIAPDESIYAVRFMGDRGYMVTYQQIDPLFVIDLATPTAPKILGELKIPGYSNYLHPYDENHLIGFGNEVDVVEDGEPMTGAAIRGMKLSLFDVSDVAHPKEVFKEVIGDRGTYSEIQYNHKALLFDKEKELLAFPITVYEMEDEDAQCSNYTYSSCPASCQKVCKPSACTFENGIQICTTDCEGENSCVAKDVWSSTKPVFAGAYVYNVNLEDGFTLKGKITHLDEKDEQNLVDMGYVTAYDKVIQRILYIAENLYTVSQGMVKANDLETLEEKNSTALAGSMYDWYGPMPLIEE